MHARSYDIGIDTGIDTHNRAHTHMHAKTNSIVVTRFVISQGHQPALDDKNKNLSNDRRSVMAVDLSLFILHLRIIVQFFSTVDLFRIYLFIYFSTGAFIWDHLTLNGLLHCASTHSALDAVNSLHNANKLREKRQNYSSRCSFSHCIEG